MNSIGITPTQRALRGPRGWTRLALLVGFTLLTLLLGLAYPMILRGPEFMGCTFDRPWFLLGLILVPVVYYRGTLGEDARQVRLRIGTVRALAVGPIGARAWFRDLPGIVRAVALALLAVAMARPLNSVVPQTSSDEGIDAVLVLDLSGSMQAVVDDLPDDLARLAPKASRQLRPTRLDAAKAVMRDFISRRKTDRIGVVVFGTAAYVVSPPTLDYHLLDSLVSHMQLELIDGNGTAIGDALGVAVARLRRSEARSKAIILLTDGDNNAGNLDPEYAAHLANTIGAKVYPIQIGSGDVAEVQDGFDLLGQPHYRQQRFPVNPALLKNIAEKTSGETYIAANAEALRESFHDVLDKLEKTKFEANVATFEDLYRFLLLPGVLLLALDALLRSLVLSRFP
ncbi:MAG TPA: VWA domain-containing protein [Polyangiaceae bacterium]|nr:VWA domain-containing protein [Polyangiaceae bacterium]